MSFEERLKMSFTKTMISCPSHQLRKTKFGHRYICIQTKSTCNKTNCPRLRRILFERKEKSGRD